MLEQIRVCDAGPADPGSVPKTHVKKLRTMHTSSARGFLLASSGIYTQTYIHTHK